MEVPSVISEIRRMALSTSRRQTPMGSEEDTGNIPLLTDKSSVLNSKLALALASASPNPTTTLPLQWLHPNPSFRPLQPPSTSQQQLPLLLHHDPSITPTSFTTPSPLSGFPQQQPQDLKISSTTQETLSSPDPTKDTDLSSQLLKYVPPKYFNLYLVFSLLFSLPIIIFIPFAVAYLILTVVGLIMYALLPCT